MVISIIGLVLLMVVVPILVCAPFIKEKDVISIKESLDLAKIPIITFEHNDSKFNFLLDTGSSESHICRSVANKLTGKTTDITYEFATANGDNSGVNSQIDTTLYYKCSKFDITLLINDTLDDAFESVRRDSGVHLHGILGSNFLTKHKYILDFAKQIVHHK